jgi:hypothetical protein
MKSHATTIVVNALIALDKLSSAYAIVQTSESRFRAFIPITAVVLLIVACILISRQRCQGPLIALVVLGFFLLQLVLLGAVSSLFPYFILHALAFVANIASFRALRQQRTRADQPPIP